MANGFEININEMDFRAKPQGEQNWILFQGIMAANNSISEVNKDISEINKDISEINKEGCEFAKKRNKYWTLKVLSAMTGAAVFALGVIYIIYQMTCR